MPSTPLEESAWTETVAQWNPHQAHSQWNAFHLADASRPLVWSLCFGQFHVHKRLRHPHTGTRTRTRTKVNFDPVTWDVCLGNALRSIPPQSPGSIPSVQYPRSIPYWTEGCRISTVDRGFWHIPIYENICVNIYLYIYIYIFIFASIRQFVRFANVFLF